MQENKPKSVLDRLTSVIGTRNPIGKMLADYQKLREANQMSQHFANYLVPVIANNDALKHEVYRIRHDVYCTELHFLPSHASGLESDAFDAYSSHCLLRHISSGAHAGTVRIVRPVQDDQQIPLEKYCASSITRHELAPTCFPRKEICEVSRLAVPKAFRRRQTDSYVGAATGVINAQTYSQEELRCFPFIAVGLYFAAAALALHEGVKHAYVMMEPRLARSMGFMGIRFQQIGPVVEYHGKRAPYYINRELLYNNLTPGFRMMLDNIQSAIAAASSN